MPRIHIEHTIDLPHGLYPRLQDELPKLSVALFSAPELRLTTQSFSMKYERILPPSTLSNDIVLSMHLHNLQERVDSSQESADTIRDYLVSALDDYGMYLGYKGPTIGVYLSFGHAEWSEGGVDDLTSDAKNEVHELISAARFGRLPN